MQVIGAAAIGALIIGLVDYVTGHEVSLAVFYLGPISVAAWYADRRAGVGIALLSCIFWYVGEEIGGAVYSHPLIPVWNALVRLSSYLIIAFLIEALRSRLELESTLSRTDALTGVLNGRAPAEHLRQPAPRGAWPTTLAFVDPTTQACERRLRPWRGQWVLCAARTLGESLRETDRARPAATSSRCCCWTTTPPAPRDRARPRTTRTVSDAASLRSPAASAR
jgi:hypothetical protein